MRALGQGEDLPAGVAREWAAGAAAGTTSSTTSPRGARGLRRPALPGRALHIADDLYAPRSGVEALVSFFGGHREVRTITPPRPAQAAHRPLRLGPSPLRGGDLGAPIRDWFLERLLPSPLGRRLGQPRR